MANARRTSGLEFDCADGRQNGPAPAERSERVRGALTADHGSRSGAFPFALPLLQASRRSRPVLALQCCRRFALSRRASHT